MAKSSCSIFVFVNKHQNSVIFIQSSSINFLVINQTITPSYFYYRLKNQGKGNCFFMSSAACLSEQNDWECKIVDCSLHNFPNHGINGKLRLITWIPTIWRFSLPCYTKVKFYCFVIRLIRLWQRHLAISSAKLRFVIVVSVSIVSFKIKFYKL